MGYGQRIYGANNVALGVSSQKYQNGQYVVAVGAYAGGGLLSSDNYSAFSNSVYLGAYAGSYSNGVSNELFIDNQDRTSYALQKSNSLIYGTFNASPSSQTVALNAATTVAYALTAKSTLNMAGASGANMLWTVDGSGDIGSSSGNRPDNVYCKTKVESDVLHAVSGITMGGGQSVKYVAKAANYTVLPTDYLVAVTDLSVSRVMTLPSSPSLGSVFIFKDQSGNASNSKYIQIVGPSGETIDGQSDYKIQAPYESIMLVYTGSNYIIV